MTAAVVKLARPAELTIAQVLDEYLAEQRARLQPHALRRYADVLHLLRGHLDGYAYESLSKPEAALFERRFNAEGDEHREYCELFGPEKIPENLGGFLGYFMIRKVMAGPDLLRAAGTVTKKLSSWLAEKGYITREGAHEARERGTAAARDLPRANRAARILHEDAEQLDVDVTLLDERSHFEFDHFTIARLEPGRLWFEVWGAGETSELGPIRVPKTATALLLPGWSISCAVARVRSTWRLLEVANVYPA
ncbi:MAG: hypothetical protein K8F56_06080 [Rhodocyclaceae bacterium]|nr:hypothetical protein [Rhodocyclaceae bacterium]